jgi:2-oxoglutarate ferredoxin oxidoreductase subunit alpha
MTRNVIFTDSSRLITEAVVQAGADVFIGYPITPANLVYYYASRRFPLFMAAPDEITTLQLMSGFAATGKMPVTATSFPGYALMIESINMAYMMELPMVIILVQRLGPATGTATMGAQGDLGVVTGTLSGGMAIPVISVSNPADCWELSARAVETAITCRTPVILLTSKEEVMTQYNLDTGELPPIRPVDRKRYASEETYMPYKPDDQLVSPFLPVGNDQHQVRFTASTHDMKGIIQNSGKEALGNSVRLHEKIVKHLPEFTAFDYDRQEGAETLVISYGITAQASREAAHRLRNGGNKVSLLVVKTLYPVPPEYFRIISDYHQVIIAEENLTGSQCAAAVTGINSFGKMITPELITREVLEHGKNIS